MAYYAGKGDFMHLRPYIVKSTASVNEYNITATRRKLKHWRILGALLALLIIGQWFYFSHLADNLQAKVMECTKFAQLLIDK